MASKQSTSIPIAVQATLNHALLQAFRPEGNVDVKGIYVCGKNSYQCILTSKSDGKMVSPTNWYTGGYMYILNRNLPDDSMKYGPFSMTDIWKLPRIPVRTSVACIDHMKRYFGYIERFLSVRISPSPLWKLEEGKPPCNVLECSSLVCIRKSLEFVKKNYQPELEMCDGIIIVPVVVSREELKHDSLRVSKRNGFFITMIKVESMWFIIQSCRQAYLEHDLSWYVVSKEYAI
jgi:hypothetical protein